MKQTIQKEALTSKYKNKFTMLVYLILFFALLLRIYHFEGHITLRSDTSRDLMIVAQSLQERQLPLIGPFSSAGPFVTGPLYYWMLILSMLFYHYYFYAPWIFMVLSSVFTVFVIMLCAYYLGDKTQMFTAGLLAATSPLLVYVSLFISNPTFILLFASCSILFFILYFQKKKVRYAFYLGLSIGLAVNMHYQALNLLIFFPAILLPSIQWKRKIIGFLCSIGGFMLTMLPLLSWDSQQNFANIRNILDYFLIGQHRIYVPNSWKIFLFKDMASFWGLVIGNNIYIGIISMILFGVYVLFATRNYHKKKLECILLGIFLFLLVLNRYYNATRQQAYLYYLVPFIILFFSITMSKFINKNKILTYSSFYLIFILCFINIAFNVGYYTSSSSEVTEEKNAAEVLSTKYPNRSFVLYDYKGQNVAYTLGVSLILARKFREDDKGMRIGICVSKCPLLSKDTMSVGQYRYSVLEKKETVKSTNEQVWQPINQKNIYDDLIGWANKHELKSTFNLFSFIKSKLYIKI